MGFNYGKHEISGFNLEVCKTLIRKFAAPKTSPFDRIASLIEAGLVLVVYLWYLKALKDEYEVKNMKDYIKDVNNDQDGVGPDVVNI